MKQIRIDTSSSNDNPLFALTSAMTVERIEALSFRGKQTACAGNLFRWPSLQQMLEDTTVRRAIIKALRRSPFPAHEASKEVRQLNLTFAKEIGWTLLDEQRFFGFFGDLIGFRIPRSFSGLCVRTDIQRHAPLTRQLNLNVCLRRNKYARIITILSLYPGPSTGFVTGNITSRNGQVMYSYDHRGIPLSS